MAARTADVDKNEEITWLSPYVRYSKWYIAYTYQITQFPMTEWSSVSLPTTLAGKAKQIGSIRPSVRYFVSTLSFEITDLWTLVCVCV